MVKKNLIFGVIFVLVIAGLVFVFAALGAPTDLIFEQNTTVNYDKEGNFTINWTAPVGVIENYSIYIYSDGVLYNKTMNTSTTSYIFSNSTEANYTFHVAAVNDTGEGDNSTNISIVVDTTAPAIEYALNMEANNANKSQTWIFVNVTASDTYNDTLSFTLYNTTGIVNQTNHTDNYTTTTINWTSLSEETYYYNVTANDSATNSNTTSTYTFVVDTTAPVATLSCSPSKCYNREHSYLYM